MKDLTCVVMAAGMGSRFGGLKQITPIDDDGNFIIDYSVFDAIKAGFNKVVFVIKREHLKDFEETIGNRLKDKIRVEYAFQDILDIPIKMDLHGREKPWGTVQAILCATPYVRGSFVVINADDFYGSNSFQEASKFLQEDYEPYTYANISYPYGKTCSDYGAVKRGVLSLDKEHIVSIIESSIEKKDGFILATPLNGSEPFQISNDTPVSMNFFAFQEDVFEILEDYWNAFFHQEVDMIRTKEALLPECLEDGLKKKKISLLFRPTDSLWLGMTYQSDLEIVKAKVLELKNRGEYPKSLWR